ALAGLLAQRPEHQSVPRDHLLAPGDVLAQSLLHVGRHHAPSPLDVVPHPGNARKLGFALGDALTTFRVLFALLTVQKGEPGATRARRAGGSAPGTPGGGPPPGGRTAPVVTTPRGGARPPCGGPRRRSTTTPRTIATAASITPNVVTIAAPVGRSHVHAARIPDALAMRPRLHPMTRRLSTPRARSAPTTAGTIRYEKTRSTPASLTELVTTRPKDV